MTGGGAGIPLKYLVLKGHPVIQDHQPIVNNYTTGGAAPSPAERFSQPVYPHGNRTTPIEYEYQVNFVPGTGLEHLHADHVELGEIWTIIHMNIEHEEGSYELRSAQRTALIASVDKVPKTVVDAETARAMETGLQDMLKEEGK